MDPQEILATYNDEALTDLGYDGTTLFPLAVLSTQIGIDLGTPKPETLIDGLQMIHDEMRSRGMIVEAHNLWDRLNEATDEPFFGGLTYSDLYPED